MISTPILTGIIIGIVICLIVKNWIQLYREGKTLYKKRSKGYLYKGHKVLVSGSNIRQKI